MLQIILRENKGRKPLFGKFSLIDLAGNERGADTRYISSSPGIVFIIIIVFLIFIDYHLEIVISKLSGKGRGAIMNVMITIEIILIIDVLNCLSLIFSALHNHPHV